MSWVSQLRALYPEPAFHVLEEVRNGTGYRRAPRTADAIVIGTWPSRGLEVIGVEVKSDRRDWLRELKDPAKAEAIAAYCDRWFLLVTDEKVAKLDEIPVAWGLLVSNGTKLKVVKAAPAFPEPKPVDRLFLAAIVRSARSNLVPQSELDRLVRDAVKGAEESAVRMQKARADRLDAEVARLQAVIDAFESESGASLGRHDWGRPGEQAKRIGRIARLLRDSDAGFADDVARAKQMAQQLAGIQASLDAFVAEFTCPSGA